jgi:tetratricopeptide (TPR) repeat protein
MARPKIGLGRAALLTAWLVAAGAGAVLAGAQNQSWWVLAATGVTGVVIQIFSSGSFGGQRSTASAEGVAARSPTLHQLPADVPDFVGRKSELKILRPDGSGPESSVCVVFGPGGVGKTSLAVHAVEQNLDDFPDGQLYVDLQGYGPNPVAPEDVLSGWLRDLGVDERLIPATLTERSRAFRSQMARKRAAIILDNAGNEQQVRPLLAGGSCVTFITSREPLGSLAASSRLQLDGLSVPESVELLSRILGADRVRGETAPAEELADASGGLPLALRVLAGRLLSEPKPLSTLLNRLQRRRAEGKLLTEFTFGDLSVEASLALSREHLPEHARDAFDLLGLHPADEWSGWSVAAVCDCSALDAEELLESLTRGQLVKARPLPRTGEPRYRMHDLVREFAKAQAVDRLTPDVRRRAVTRLASAYLAMAERADSRLHPSGSRHAGRTDAPRYPIDPDTTERSAEDALGWFKLESEAVAAVVAECHRLGEWVLCWELTDAVSVGLENLRIWDTGMRIAELGLSAAESLGSDKARAAVLRNLGEIDREMGRKDRAIARLEESIRLFRALGDSYGTIDASCNLGLVEMRWGNPQMAEQALTVALDEARRIKDARGEAWTLEIMGECAVIRGDRQGGAANLALAADLFAGAGELRGEAFARSNQALLLIDHLGWSPIPPLQKRPLSTAQQGEALQARTLLDHAQTSFVDLGDSRNLAMVALARIRLAVLEDKDGPAHADLLDVADMEGFDGDWRLRGLLVHGDAVLDHRSGSTESALEKSRAALALVEPFGDRPSTACIKLHLGVLLTASAHGKAEGQVLVEEAKDLFLALDRRDGVRRCDEILTAH